MDDRLDQRRHLQRCLRLAAEAARAGRVPVGAVLVAVDGSVLGWARRGPGPLDHAELVLLRRHQRRLAAEPLAATLYSSLEPCLMCLDAALHARVRRIVFAARDGWREWTALLQATPYLRYRSRSLEIVPEPDPELRAASRRLMATYWRNRGAEDRAEAFLREEPSRHWA